MAAVCSTSAAHPSYARPDANVTGPPRTPQFTAPLLGEPLNVILSGLSDPYVLTEEGFREYTKSFLSLHPPFIAID
jgi:hypothetical protein